MSMTRTLDSRCTQGGSALVAAVAVDMFFLGSALTAAMSARIGQKWWQRLGTVLALPLLLLATVPLGSLIAATVPLSVDLVLLGAGCAALLFLVCIVVLCRLAVFPFSSFLVLLGTGDERVGEC